MAWEKILTRAEAYEIGGEGTLEEDDRCCTREVAESYGCTVDEDYTNNQLISKADAGNEPSYPDNPDTPTYFKNLVSVEIVDWLRNEKLEFLKYFNSQGDISTDNYTEYGYNDLLVQMPGGFTTTLYNFNNDTYGFFPIPDDIQEGVCKIYSQDGEIEINFNINPNILTGNIGETYTLSNQELQYTIKDYACSFYFSGGEQFTMSGLTHESPNTTIYYDRVDSVIRGGINIDTMQNVLWHKIQIVIKGNTKPFTYIYFTNSGTASDAEQAFFHGADIDTGDPVSAEGYIWNGKDGTDIKNYGVWQDGRYRMYISESGLNLWENNDEEAYLSVNTIGNDSSFKRPYGTVKLHRDPLYSQQVFKVTTYEPSNVLEVMSRDDIFISRQGTGDNVPINQIECYNVVRTPNDDIFMYFRKKTT